METIHGVDFQAVQIDRHGALKDGADAFVAHVRDHAISDVIVICHGFRNDENDARRLYTEFLKNFAVNRAHASLAAKLAGRTYAMAGVFWPSMIFPEPDDSEGSAQSADDAAADNRARLHVIKAGLDASAAAKIDDLLAHVDAAPDDSNARLKMAATLIDLVRDLKVDDKNEVHAALASATPAELCKALEADAIDIAAPGSGGGGAIGIPGMGAGPVDLGQGLSNRGRILGFVPKFLNLTTFLLMFHRCGVVGEKGISALVRKVVAAAHPRIHLVGHSLGGRAVTACAKALVEAPAVKVDTMMLLEAAYSHFGLSAAATASSPIQHPRGHFRDVIEKGAVKGPILATHSTHDAVVQFAYTPMAAISLNNSKAIGDENSPFGGMGRNGVLDAKEAAMLELNEAGVAYTFASDKKIHNLNGSRAINNVPLIASHGDVKSPAITWAFATLVASV